MAKIKKSKTSSKATGGIESRIMAVADIPSKLNLLLYGRSGTGKTTIVGSAPKPLLVLDIREGGTTSIKKREDTYVLPITSWKDFEEVYWYLVNNEGKYKSVAIDTTTQLQDFALAEIRGSADGLVSRKSWGEASSLMKTWIALFKDLPMNVIFTAQDRKTKGQEDEEDDSEDNSIMPEIGPYVMPSVAKILNAAVDVIGMTYIRETTKTTKPKKKGDKPTETTVMEYCLRVGPHPVFLTKFRSPVEEGETSKIPNVLVSPTFEEILELSLDED